MNRNKKLGRCLTLGAVAAFCIVAALVTGVLTSRLEITGSADATGGAMGWETELAVLLKQPETNRMDIARMNLLAGSGLGRGEEMALTNLVRELDAMTARVKAETARHVARFQRAPVEFNGSEAYFKMLCLVTVLQQDFGIRYSPQRAQPVEGRIEPNETFYAEAADVFLHGLLGPRRMGTCASLPVLYAAVGRRLGYPLKLVTAKNHLFVRWDGLGERLNIEATTAGMTTFDDEYYRGWPFPMSPEEEVEERYLKSLDSREELAVFLSQRTHCLLAMGKRSQAVANQRRVCELAPYSAVQRQFLKHLENQHGREIGRDMAAAR